jgi:type IV pilus assembly protein PilB
MAPRDWLFQFVQDGTISKDQLAEANDAAGSLGISVDEALVRLE